MMFGVAGVVPAAGVEPAVTVSAAMTETVTATVLISRQAMTTGRNRCEGACGFSIRNSPVYDMPDDVGSAETESRLSVDEDEFVEIQQESTQGWQPMLLSVRLQRRKF